MKCIYDCSIEGGESEDGRELGLPGLLYADNLVLCGELDKDLRAMVASFVDM